MRSKVIRINKKAIMALIFFIPVYKPQSINYLSPLLDTVFNVLLIVFAFILLFIGYYKKVKLLDSFSVCALSYAVIEYAVTIRMRGDLYLLSTYIVRYMYIWLYIRIILIEIQASYEIPLLILKCWFYLNIVSYFLYPEGMYVAIWKINEIYTRENYLMGSKNGYVFPVSFAFLLLYMCINQQNRKMKLKDTVFVVACYFTVLFISKSSTGIIAMVLLGIYILAKNTLLNSKRAVGMLITLNIVLFGAITLISNNMPLLQALSYITGKSITLNNRTDAWRDVISVIMSKPIFGYGCTSEYVNLIMFHRVHTHSIFLQAAYEGGIVLLTAFALLIAVVLKKIYMNYEEDEKCKFFLWTIFVLLIAGIADLNKYALFSALCVSYYGCNRKLIAKDKR
ncbi:MAG: O-antigen ligase family protein [Blautia sp.]|nr:O-antigen ligase family protein [Blautia sp.]